MQLHFNYNYCLPQLLEISTSSYSLWDCPLWSFLFPHRTSLSSLIRRDNTLPPSYYTLLFISCEYVDKLDDLSCMSVWMSILLRRMFCLPTRIFHHWKTKLFLKLVQTSKLSPVKLVRLKANQLSFWESLRTEFFQLVPRTKSHPKISNWAETFYLTYRP